MISLAAIPTDRPSICLRPFAELLGPYACLSYISGAATVEALIYGCLSLAPTPPPAPLLLQQMVFGYLLRERNVPNRLNKYNKQEFYGEVSCDCNLLVTGEGGGSVPAYQV